MTSFGPSSLDLLATQGIIPYDAQAFITGEPSPYLQQYGISTPQNPQLAHIPPLKRQPLSDSYSPATLTKDFKEHEPGILKKIGAIALGTYILGFICSKGKKNPLEGIKAIYSLASRPVKWLAKKFKKP